MPQRRLVFIVLNISITVVFAKSISSSPEERALMKQKRHCGDNFELSAECEDVCRRQKMFQLCKYNNATCVCDLLKEDYDDTSTTLFDLNDLREPETQKSAVDHDATHTMTGSIDQRTNNSSESEAGAPETDRTRLSEHSSEPTKVGDHKKSDTAVIHAADVEPITAGKTKANGTSDEKKDADKRPDSTITQKPAPKDGAVSVTPRVEDQSKDKATNPIAEGATKVHAEKQDAAELPAEATVKPHVEEEIKGSVIKHDSKDASTEAVPTLDHHVDLKDGPEAPLKKQQNVVHAETHVSSAEYSSKPESSSTQGAKLQVVSGKVTPHVQSLEKPSSESSQPGLAPLPVSSSAHTLSSATVKSDSLSNISSDEVPHTPHSSEELTGVEAIEPFDDNYVAPARAFKSAINDKSMLSALISQTFILSAVIVYVALCAIFMYMRSYRKRKYDRVPLLENFSDCNDL